MRQYSGAYFEFDVTTQFRSLQIDMPDFVIVLFRTNRDGDDPEKDSRQFDYCRVKNMYLTMVELKPSFENILIPIL